MRRDRLYGLTTSGILMSMAIDIGIPISSTLIKLSPVMTDLIICLTRFPRRFFRMRPSFLGMRFASELGALLVFVKILNWLPDPVEPLTSS